MWDFLPISAELLVQKNATEAAHAVMRARVDREMTLTMDNGVWPHRAVEVDAPSES